MGKGWANQGGPLFLRRGTAASPAREREGATLGAVRGRTWPAWLAGPARPGPTRDPGRPRTEVGYGNLLAPAPKTKKE
jgi:hypothetical protein